MAYRSVERKFKFIDGESAAIVPTQYSPESEPDIVQSLLGGFNSSSPSVWYRRIAPVTVSVRPRELAEMKKLGWIEPHESGINLYTGPYSNRFGLASGIELTITDLFA